MDDYSGLLEVKAPRQARSQRALVQIVEAAEEALRQDGDGFSIADVAARAGVSVGNVYRRFDDKQHLVRAVKDRVLNRLESSIVERLAVGAQPTLHDTVTNFVDVLVSTFATDERLFAVILNSRSDEGLRVRGHQGLARTHEVLSIALQRHASELRHPDPDLASAMAFFMVMGAIGRKLNFVSREDAEPFRVVTWPVLRRELALALLGYLAGDV